MTLRDPHQSAETVVNGPHFKGPDQYLSRDGDNPEAPWPGYGWPLGSTCWFFRLDDRGALRWATGSTVEKAWARAIEIHLGFDGTSAAEALP